MRRRYIFVLGAGWLIPAACSLNPQPLPPEEPGGDVTIHTDGGSDFGGGNGDADAGAVPTNGSDGGDASAQTDATAPSNDGSTPDAGDAAADAPPDGDLDAAPDAPDLDATSNDAGD